MKSSSLSSLTIHGIAAANGVDSESVSCPMRMCIFCRRSRRWGSRPNGVRPCACAGLHERVPQVLAVGARVVDLVADLADEADAQDQARHARDRARACRPCRRTPRSSSRGRVTLGHDLARLRAGEVDGGDRLRDVRHVDVHLPVGQPPAEPLLHRRRAARRRRDVERLVVEAADRAVVDDAPRVGADDAVADAPRLEVREAVGVQAVEERAGVRAAHEHLAERRDVDQAGRLLDRDRLALRVAVVVGAAPVAGPRDPRAELAVAAVDRRALRGLDRPPGERADGTGVHGGRAVVAAPTTTAGAPS